MPTITMTAARTPRHADGCQCPRCGTFLDPPRVDRATGFHGHKCMSCLAWFPVVAAAGAARPA